LIGLVARLKWRGRHGLGRQGRQVPKRIKSRTVLTATLFSLSWSEASFREYIKDPRAKFPDTRMMFVGIKDDAEIGELWAYLKQFGPDGKKK
jgi:cytochrome c2